MGLIAEIAYPLPVHRTFDYSIPSELKARILPGMRVRAPFGPRGSLSGTVMAVRDGTSKFKLKAISSLLDPEPLASQETLALAAWLAERYCAPIGECLKMMVPANLRSAKRAITIEASDGDWKSLAGKSTPPTFTLTPGQDEAVRLVAKKLEARTFSTTLLFGVPASGKTEVYIRLIRKAVEAGGQAMFLVPEITLTRPFFEEFKAAIGLPVALWHSQIGARRKRSVWLGLRSGKVRVVVGARSAALLPFKDLRLIVMDEEQDESYKQDGQVPYYHAREVVLKRAKTFNATAILGSATPSIEAFARQGTKGFDVVRMDQRISRTTPPTIRIIDRPPEYHGGCLTEELLERTKNCLERGEQVILLVNRRGYSNFVMCKRCSWVARCPACNVAYIHHKTGGGGGLFGDSYLLCHHCGQRGERPSVCGKCRKGEFRYAGIGTQKVVEEIKRRLPGARILRMDRDTVSKEKVEEEESIYADFLARKADILVGTKLVAKGFHFPDVTLVGIVDADTMLSMPDFRAAERTVQMLIQAAGRAGRAEKPGQVLLQTAQATHYAIQAVARGDYGAFARTEMGLRSELFYPPCSTLVRAVFQGAKEDTVMKASRSAGKALAKQINAKDEILGPAPGVHAKLQGRYRFHILLKILDEARLPEALLCLRQLKLPSTVRLKVNVDPYDFF